MKKIDLIKFFVVIAMVAGFAFKSNAQSAERHWAVGAYANIFEYKGDYGNEFFSFDFDEVEVRGGISVAKYLTPSFDLAGRFSIGQLNHDADPEDEHFAGNSFNASYFVGNVNLVYKFYNDYLLPADFIIQPFVTAGLGGGKISGHGYSNAWGDYGEKDKVVTPANLYAGLGFKVRVSPSVGINIQTGYMLPMSDRVDGQNWEAWDQLWEHSLGFEYRIANPMDTDGDGIADNNDRCPETPEGAEVDRHGCAIDSDNDGVPDYADSCVYEPGLLRFNGCPDTDGDGIQDAEDECPEEAGIKKFDGCPDTDRDGIEDRDDDCPEQPGPLEMNGCPCDYKPVELCGDDDGDGVSNAKDECPDTPKGVTVNEVGCPEKADTAEPTWQDDLTKLETLIDAAETVKFETAKSVILPKGKETIDKIITIMKGQPNLHLKISGYCDSRSSDAYNLALSKRRATAVRNYFIDQGIGANRIEAEGYGEANPVATNSTAEGRRLNRRVEFKVFVP